MSTWPCAKILELSRQTVIRSPRSITEYAIWVSSNTIYATGSSTTTPWCNVAR